MGADNTNYLVLVNQFICPRPGTNDLVGVGMVKTTQSKLLGARVLERLRRIEGGTQVTLAKAAGMRQQGVGMIIAGEVERPRKLREIAAYLGTSQEYLLGETNDPAPPSLREVDVGSARELPILSLVNAGQFADVSAVVRAGDLPTILVGGLGRGDYFALRVDGDSMDRVSPQGSVVVVNRSDRTLVSGKPYIFAIRGQATYKLWHPKPIYLAPFSTNPSNEPIFVERKRDFEVIGRVRRTILDL